MDSGYDNDFKISTPTNHKWENYIGLIHRLTPPKMAVQTMYVKSLT